MEVDGQVYLDEIERFNPAIREHAEHRWRQVGHCVYCECGEKLYQGRVPTDHPTFTPPRRPDRGRPDEGEMGQAVNLTDELTELARTAASTPHRVRFDEVQRLAANVLSLVKEVARLRGECSTCESCGHIQAEPNWCHLCGRRVAMPDWAKRFLGATSVAERDALAAKAEAGKRLYEALRDHRRLHPKGLNASCSTCVPLARWEAVENG